MTWQTLLSGDADLNRDLNVSVDAYGRLRFRPPPGLLGG